MCKYSCNQHDSTEWRHSFVSSTLVIMRYATQFQGRYVCVASNGFRMKKQTFYIKGEREGKVVRRRLFNTEVSGSVLGPTGLLPFLSRSDLEQVFCTLLLVMCLGSSIYGCAATTYKSGGVQSLRSWENIAIYSLYFNPRMAENAVRHI